MKFKKNWKRNGTYFVELSSTNTYKEDTSFKQTLGIIIKRLNKVNNEKYERETNQIYGKMDQTRRQKIQDFSWGLCKAVNFNCFDYQYSQQSYKLIKKSNLIN